MNCQAFHQTFSDYIDGVLDAADTVRARQHIEACGPCRRMEEAYRAGVAALRDAERQCPARDLSVRILHRVRRERRLPALFGAYGAAGALLLATLVAVVVLDIQERRADRASAGDRIAQADPDPLPPLTPSVDRRDRITFRVRDASEPAPGDAYSVLRLLDPDPSFRITMEVPAVWSGR